jgi:hypothetical protein
VFYSTVILTAARPETHREFSPHLKALLAILRRGVAVAAAIGKATSEPGVTPPGGMM